MSDMSSLCLFSGEPLDRASELRADKAWMASRLADPDSLFVPLYRGDPLIADGKAGFLSAAAHDAFGAEAMVVFLGLAGGRAHFAIDASAATSPTSAPFADLGAYTPLREAALALPESDLAIIGQGRWLLDWHRRHRFCANCGAETASVDGGAKRLCAQCDTEHFPRTDPVAIVLAIHGDACLLGRSPRFPARFLSALAGFVEAAETPEACAVRELNEEAGVVLTRVEYLFSQPWPFPSSLMMGFLAAARSRELRLDRNEIEEARWVSKPEIQALLAAGGVSEELRLPPSFTIARRLIETWAARP